MISFGPLDPDADLPGLLRASAAEFGAEGYQQTRRYLDWLYRANPAGRGFGDGLVARRGGEIVGCVHRMILPLAGPDGPQTLAVLHNHFVEESARSGPGVLLLRRAVKDVAVGFSPGVQAPLDQVYRRLGFVEHPGSWLIRVLDPVGAALGYARARLGARGPLRLDARRIERRFGSSATFVPSEAQIERLCNAMRAAAPPEAAAVAWTPALVRWRFFDPLGPRHLLVSDPESEALAVIAPGMRHSLRVARLVEAAGPVTPRFLAQVERAMRAAGAVLGLSFSTDPFMVRSLQAGEWRVRGNETFSFRTPGLPLKLTAAASDVGFEAIATEIR